MPQIMYTFFDTYDLKGKNIIPFCTHAGSGLSGTVEKIKNLEPQATVYYSMGFISGEHHIPSENELKDLLQYVDYKKVSLKENVVTLPDKMKMDLGGNIQAVGTKPDGSDWRIGLKDPESEGGLGVLSISDCAVVTSGNYERYFIGEDGKVYGHIINPKTGYPAESGLLSVTIIAQEGKLCDALSTSLFVMGCDKAAEYWREHKDFEMILVTEDGEIHLTEGIKDKFELGSAYSDRNVNVIDG